MNLCATLLKVCGWKVIAVTPDFPKSIICVAPHTSNWDFILGELAINSVGRKSGFLMKSSWFVFPLGYFFRALGGIPVKRNKNSSLVSTIIDLYKERDEMTLAVTPEGTRKKTSNWKTGFLRIAYGAKVPLQLAAIDYAKKEISLTEVFEPTYDLDADMKRIKEYYKDFKGYHPEGFSVEDQTIDK